MKRRVKLKIIGKVQGVNFRREAKFVANSLDICGWVKNLGDGAVEVFAEGEEGDLERLIEWAKAGPSAARVDHVFVEWLPYSGEFDEFKVR